MNPDGAFRSGCVCNISQKQSDQLDQIGKIHGCKINKSTPPEQDVPQNSPPPSIPSNKCTPKTSISIQDDDLQQKISLINPKKNKNKYSNSCKVSPTDRCESPSKNKIEIEIDENLILCIKDKTKIILEKTLNKEYEPFKDITLFNQPAINIITENSTTTENQCEMHKLDPEKLKAHCATFDKLFEEEPNINKNLLFCTCKN
jgi:hypothetical protein